MCGAHLYNPEVYQTIPCGIPRVGVNAGSLNVTVRSWLLSLNKGGRGVSGQPPAEPARSQSGCLSRGQALADGRDCRGPAPVDPGNSKGGRRWRGKTCLLIDIRLD